MNIHDSGYKKLFSNQTIFRQLLETFVNQEWVNQLDFSTCETLDKSFISQHYQETESDLIYHILRAMPPPLGWEQLGRSLCSRPKHVH